MQTCVKCGARRYVSEFYANDRTCKDCRKRMVRENRAKNAEYYRAYDAQRFKSDPNVAERHTRYRATPQGRASVQASRLKWIAKNPEKRAAHIEISNALRDGRLKKPCGCERCGSTGVRLEAHHADYSKPLEVEFLCRQCHVDTHKENT